MKTVYLLFFLSLILGCGEQEQIKNEKETIQVDEAKFPVIVEEVKQGSVQKLLKSQGRLEAKRIASISPQVAGRISSHHFEEGQVVDQNALLIQLSTPPGVDLNIDKLRLRISQSNLKLKRQRSLLKEAPDAIAKHEIEESTLNVQELKLDLKKQLEETELRALRAPFAGVVVEKQGDVGQQIGINTQLAKLLDISELRVSLDIPETRLQELKKKQIVLIEYLSDKSTSQGYIESLPAAISEQSGSGRVIIGLKDIPSHWRVGSFVAIQFQMEKIDAPRVISRSAILYKQNRPYVWIAQEKAGLLKARRVWIQLGEGDRDKIIVNDGLKAGDLVVTKGHSSLSADMVLDIQQTMSPVTKK